MKGDRCPGALSVGTEAWGSRAPFFGCGRVVGPLPPRSRGGGPRPAVSVIADAAWTGPPRPSAPSSLSDPRRQQRRASAATATGTLLLELCQWSLPVQAARGVPSVSPLTPHPRRRAASYNSPCSTPVVTDFPPPSLSSTASRREPSPSAPDLAPHPRTLHSSLLALVPPPPVPSLQRPCVQGRRWPP